MPFYCENGLLCENQIPERSQKQSNPPSSPSHLNLRRAPPPISAGPPWQELEELSPLLHQAARGLHQRPMSKAPHPSLRDHCAPHPRFRTTKSPPVGDIIRASIQPPKKKAKVSEPTLIDLSEPEEPASEPQPSRPEPQPSRPPKDSRILGMTPEAIIRRPYCRARPFHSELCFDVATFRLQPQLRDSFHLLRRYHLEQLLTPRDFFYPRVAMDFYQSMTTHHVRDPSVIHFSIDGRHGILGARHIADALRIPYEPLNGGLSSRINPSPAI
ncbi:hypothetical protein AAG906_021806 [Vitis piasezkii]